MTRWHTLTFYSMTLLVSVTIAAIAISLATQHTPWYWVFVATAGVYGIVSGMALSGLWRLYRRR